MNKNIGIFWIYENKVFSEFQSLENIQPINNFKDSDLSHYQAWDTIKKQHPRFYLYEYEDIPRGRVVYNIENCQFIIYCNKNILKNELQKNLFWKSSNCQNLYINL